MTVPPHSAVACVTFARPPNNNFDLDLIVALADALEDIDHQSDFRAVVLRSEGKVFCARAKFVGAEGDSAIPGAGDLPTHATSIETPFACFAHVNTSSPRFKEPQSEAAWVLQ